MHPEKTITKKAVRKVLSDYWRQYKKYPWLTVGSFLLPALGDTLIGFVPPLIVARLVNVLASGTSVTLGNASTYIIAFGAVWLFGEVLWRFGFHFLIKIETYAGANLGKIAFGRLAARDYDFYTNNFVGSLTKRATAFSRGFETFTDTLTFNVVNSILPIVFAVIVLWHYSSWIPVLLVAMILVATIIGIPIIKRRSRLVALRHEAGSRVSGRISDALTNILVIKSFSREKFEQKVFGTYVDDYAAKFKKAGDYHNLRVDMFMAPMYVIANVIGLSVAIFFTNKLALPVGTMVVVFSYYAQVTRVFFQINRVYRNIESSVSEAAEFTQLTIDAPAVVDAPAAGRLKADSGRIEFEDVGFAYNPSGNDEVSLFLNGFNLEIKPKEKIGLVGPSGGGKTTITKLLLRFIDLNSGNIKIDGQDISKVTQASLRDAISYVPQDPLLFHRSLFENIAYGNENATEEKVMEAARLARADEFIEKLPNKYKTLVGERGIKLSGGQRQRVAIARALLKNAPILILDEATSSLDSESEKYIQEGLWELMKDKTALVIAHRLSTIKHLDRIIVLEKGKIVQEGTHDELIAKGGLYARLWNHQSGGFLEE